MRFLTKTEIQKLSFPDCKAMNMEFDIPSKKIKIKTDSGFLSINGGEKLGACKLILQGWQSIKAVLYRTKTKQWESLDINNIEKVVDICEFEFGEEIIFRGFGAKTEIAWIESAFADKSYHGKEHHPADIKIFISGKKNLPIRFQKLLKSRSAIEPIIGHMKNDHQLGRNYLLGKVGDKVNAVLSGCAFKLNKIINYSKIEQNCFA